MRRLLVLVMVTVMLSEVPRAGAAEPIDFAEQVQPIFSRHCTACHGTKRRESGLRLDHAAGLMLGGDRGRVVVAGQSAASRLLAAVTGSDDELGRMPPEGPGLSEAEIGVLRAWIEQGAKVPKETSQAAVSSAHWAFRQPERPPLPEVRRTGWIQSPLDYFVLARLEREGLAPSPPAAADVLVRRLSLDLRGIPPTVDEIQQYVRDDAPDAYARLVERFLGSPMYGERWGRHWLDQARYADSNGFTRDFGREIWKYRDWLIGALNADMPFDQFTIEQFAGDLLPDAGLTQRIATGFHRNTLINEEGGTDDEQFRVDAVADRVATTGVVYLGLTIGCARCHSHKFDPITQREYYELFAFLNNCDEPTIEAPATWQGEELERRAEIRGRIAQLEEQLDADRESFEAAQQKWEEGITPEFRVTLPGPVQEALMIPLADRKEEEKKLVEDVFRKSEAGLAVPLVKQIVELEKSEPAIPTTMVLAKRAAPRETHVHRRGNFLDLGERVFPGVPGVLHALEAEQPGRLDLARWLVDANNPLTPRVIVNRDWQRFFGRGIVETENDFGTQGTPPTHPRLLDWLATEWIAQGWSFKALHRLIVMSATYRQSSRFRPELASIDPANRLLARQSRLRLEAEIIRDSALASSGLLVRVLGGPSVHPPQPDGVFAFTQDKKPWDTETGSDRYRRGMYTFFWRSSPYPALMVFDAPKANVTCTRRVRSNTPLQALTLANDVQFIECARALADNVLAGASQTEDRLRDMFRRCLARPPADAELARLRQLLDQQHRAFAADPDAAGRFLAGETPDIERAAWAAVARVLMNTDEFITRE